MLCSVYAICVDTFGLQLESRATVSPLGLTKTEVKIGPIWSMLLF